MTDAEKKELEALKAKNDLTDDEKTRLTELEALAAKKDGGKSEKTYSEAYVKGLRSENAKYRTKAKEVEETLAQYDGIDPDEIRKLQDAAKEAETKKLEQAGEWDKLRDQLVETHNDELATKDTVITEKDAVITGLQSEVESIVLSHEIAVQAAIAEAINPQLVEMVAKGMTKVERLEDGKRVVRVLDAEGNERVDIKTGEKLTVANLLDEMKQANEYAHLFKGGKIGAGSGTETQFGGKSIDNPWKKDSFNLTLQGKVIRENPELAQKLKNEAGV